MIDPIDRTRNILEEIRKIIKREDDFLITTHIHPDGDSIASVLLFAAILTKYKKTYRIIVDDCIPLKFDFLSNIDRIQTHTDPINDFHPRVVIVLDSASLSRIKR